MIDFLKSRKVQVAFAAAVVLLIFVVFIYKEPWQIALEYAYAECDIPKDYQLVNRSYMYLWDEWQFDFMGRNLNEYYVAFVTYGHEQGEPQVTCYKYEPMNTTELLRQYHEEMARREEEYRKAYGEFVAELLNYSSFNRTGETNETALKEFLDTYEGNLSDIPILWIPLDQIPPVNLTQEEIEELMQAYQQLLNQTNATNSS